MTSKPRCKLGSVSPQPSSDLLPCPPASLPSPLLLRAPLSQALAAESTPPPPQPQVSAQRGHRSSDRLFSLPARTQARLEVHFPESESGDLMFTSLSLCQKQLSRGTFPLETALLMGPDIDGVLTESPFLWHGVYLVTGGDCSALSIRFYSV